VSLARVRCPVSPRPRAAPAGNVLRAVEATENATRIAEPPAKHARPPFRTNGAQKARLIDDVARFVPAQQAALLVATLNSEGRTVFRRAPCPAAALLFVSALISLPTSNCRRLAVACKMTGAADFHAQADALFRKNLAIQVSILQSPSPDPSTVSRFFSHRVVCWRCLRSS